MTGSMAAVDPLDGESSPVSVRRVLYHHRTQGKAVEAVHIRGVVDVLRGRGVKVDVMSIPGADPYAPDKGVSPLKQRSLLARLVWRLPEPLFELVELAYNLIAAFRVLRCLLRNRDTEFIYERYSLFLFATTLVARWRKVPIILEINDSAAVPRVRPLAFGRLARLLERWTFRSATGLVFVSTRFRNIIATQYPGLAPAIVTPNAANVGKFTFTEEQRLAARTKLGLEGAVVCGYLGAFVPWHAIDDFVFLMASRLDEAPRLKLLLVGDGATFEAVRRFVAEHDLESRIVLAGRVQHDDVPSLLAAMDFAILPSAGDYTSPVKLFEFMASGIPPVAPDLEPIREVLQEGRTGWMFPAGNLHAAVSAVIERSSDAAGLAAVGSAAREYIVAERQWSNNVEQLLRFHRELTSN